MGEVTTILIVRDCPMPCYTSAVSTIRIKLSNDCWTIFALLFSRLISCTGYKLIANICRLFKHKCVFLQHQVGATMCCAIHDYVID
jgi:hypothetical protein